MDPGSLLAGLDDDQRRAVASPARPLAVLAPAGSGKTRVLTTRIAHRIATEDAAPAHVLCVTFTRRAAGELGSRLRDVGIRERIEAGTFHAIAWRQLQDRWARQGRQAPALLDHPRRFLSEHLPRATADDLQELENEMAWSRARLIRPDAYAGAASRAGRRTRRPADWLATEMATFERAKTRRHVVDFDDLLAACAAAIEGDPEFAAAQRWRFRHLFVDEFQDVNPLQFRLLEAWRGDRWDVFVVGDTHQSIYGWNGADPRLLDDLQTRWPPLETLHLTRTHRSTPQITAAAASVVAAAGLPDRHPMATGVPGPVPKLLPHDTGTAEIESIAQAIRNGRGGETSWRHFAVLTRTQAHVGELDRGLRALGLPTRVRRSAAGAEDEDSNVAFPPSHDDADEVTISTMHAAKGLEWPVVHIAGCEDGWLPVTSARRRTALDEEARLLYVALTRARRELTVHWARERVLGTRKVSRRPSPFLARFDADVEASRGPEPPAPGPRLAALRSTIPRPAQEDPVLRDLRAWRDEQARVARTDPDVIVPDEVLRRIASSRPRTLADLDAVPGLGAARARRHGSRLVEVVSRHGPGS